MADDSQRAKARATFGKTFFDNAKPKPLAKNAATASQKVANSRPIPTYKDGGKVMSDRIAARIAAGNYGKGGKVQTSADTARKLATEMGGMKDGGSCGMKPVKKAVGGTGKTRKGMAPIKKKDGGVAKKADGGKMTEAQYEANMRAQRATRQAPPAAPRSSRRPAVDDLSPEYLKRRELRQKGIIPQSEMQATRNLAFRNRQAMDKNIRQQDIRVKGSDVGMSGADADQYFYVSRPGGGASDELVRAVAGPKQVVKMGDFTDQFSAQNQRIYDNLKAQGAIMKKGGVVKKKDGGTIKLDLNQVKRETALRDAAAKKRAEAERYRKMMGSQEDILARGERSQARDTEESRSMKPVKRARGGAGKVRKGMMTPKGDIKQAVKPKKGIGGIM